VTQRRDLPQSAEIWVEATPAEQRVEPGDQAVWAIAVENRSSGAQQQSIAIGGVPSDWTQIQFDTRGRAFPQERRNGTVTISVPLDADPGVREIAIVARADGAESTAAATLEVLATEARPLEPGLNLQPAVLEVDAGGDERRVQVDVRNVDARDAEYALSVSGLAAGWHRMTERLRIPAGGSGEAELWLRAPASARGGALRFAVHVALADDPEVFTDASGELRVTAVEEPADRPLPEAAPPRPEPPAEGPPIPVPPPPVEVRPLAEDEFETVVRAPDVLLAPGTAFRFGEGDVLQQAILTIQNRSRITERYVIEVSGLPDRWYALTADDISLEAGDTQQVPMRLSPRPGPEHPAGEYHFRIRVMPHGYPDAAADIVAVLNVEGVESYEQRIDPPQAMGRTVRYQLTLRNTGTRPVQLETAGSDPEGRVKFRIAYAPEIEAGREVTIPLTVGAKRNRFVGSPETFDFRLHSVPTEADPDEAGRTLDARFIHRPYLSKRVPVLASFYFVLTVLVVFLFFWAPPHVVGFFHWSGCKIDSSGQECQPQGQRIADVQGEVVEVSVQQGDFVREGDRLFLVQRGEGDDAEQFEVLATQDGQIVEVLPTTGDTIAEGDLIARYEDAELPAPSTATPEPTATIETPGTTTPTATAPATPPPAVAAACVNDAAQSSQVPGLRVGSDAYADDRSNIRSGPGIENDRIGQIQIDSVPADQREDARRVRIIGGPECGSDFTWWQIRSEFYDIADGWLVELDGEGNVNVSPEP
jgi:uncharacterized membrane protein